MNLIFRASSVGALLIDSKESSITHKQLQTIEELQTKTKLTAKQSEELERLISKRDTPEELSAGAKTLVRETWLQQKYGFDLPVVADIMENGKLSEQSSIALLDEVWPVKGFRMNNKERKTDDYFTGEIDIDLPLEDCIEDVKSPFTLKTYSEVSKPDRDYVAQAQVYMHLWNRSHYRLHYCLVPTDESIVENLVQKNFWKHGGIEGNDDHERDAEMIRKAHALPSSIPACDRVRTFLIDRDEAYITKLKKRVDMARDYAQTLSLFREPQKVIVAL